MSAWAATITRRSLFGYVLLFSTVGWLFDVVTTLVDHTIPGLQELSPIVQLALQSNPGSVILFFLLPLLMIGFGFMIWKTGDPSDTARRINTAMMAMLLIGSVHMGAGVGNILVLLTVGP